MFGDLLTWIGEIIVAAWVWVGEIIVAAWVWVGEQQAPVIAVATVVTAVVAWVALVRTASDSRERSRPVVLAMFRLAEHNDSAFDFVVRNYGASAASDVEVTFNPPIDAERRQDALTNSLATRYDAPIPLLPPAAEVTNLWWTGRVVQGEKQMVNGLRTPDQVTVTISYKGARFRRYRNTIPLDANWMGLQTSSMSSTSTPGRMGQITDAIKKIAAEATPLRRYIGQIADALDEDDDEQGGHVAEDK